MSSIPRLFLASAGYLLTTASLSACGSATAPPAEPSEVDRPTNAEVAELEISSSNVDRFSWCPPPGELGQGWIPPLAPWTPAPLAKSAEPLPAQPSYSRGVTPTERAIADTLPAFRSCYRHGLFKDATQDGHVAIVARVTADGRVAKVETYAGCDLSSEAIACMMAATRTLRFDPPADGSATIVIPAVFAPRQGHAHHDPSSNDVYTAGAFLTVESARPALHACEEGARHAGKPVEASGTFTLELDARGKVLKQNVDPWHGDQELLKCAAAVIEKLQFAPPAGGKGNMIARLIFNPRAGTK
jgi:hypothetical protein